MPRTKGGALLGGILAAALQLSLGAARDAVAQERPLYNPRAHEHDEPSRPKQTTRLFVESNVLYYERAAGDDWRLRCKGPCELDVDADKTIERKVVSGSDEFRVELPANAREVSVRFDGSSTAAKGGAVAILVAGAVVLGIGAYR